MIWYSKDLTLSNVIFSKQKVWCMNVVIIIFRVTSVEYQIHSLLAQRINGNTGSWINQEALVLSAQYIPLCAVQELCHVKKPLLLLKGVSCAQASCHACICLAITYTWMQTLHYIFTLHYFLLPVVYIAALWCCTIKVLMTIFFCDSITWHMTSKLDN